MNGDDGTWPGEDADDREERDERDEREDAADRGGPEEHLATLLASLERASKEAEASEDVSAGTSSWFDGWWIRAARAAALGHPEPFERWPALAGSRRIRGGDVIDRLGRSILQRLETAAGPAGDEAVVDAEDLGCLSIVEPSVTGLIDWDVAAVEMVRLVVAAAESRVLSEAGVEAIRRHARWFPLPAPYRLPAVAEPLSGIDLVVAAAPASPVRHVAATPMVAEPEAVLFDGGRPSTSMIERFAGREGEAVTPGGHLLRAAPRLDRWWGVRVRLEGDGAASVAAARLGSRGLERLAVEDPDAVVFETSLAGLSPDVQSRLVASEIMLRSIDGGRFTM